MSAPTTTARRVTPTAVRVLPADAPRDVWLAERRRGIGSSDVAAVLGLVEKSTPAHVYADKRGELPEQDPTEPMLWGSLLEDVVAREWARRNRSVVARVGLVAHEAESWMLATLDRRVAECPLDRSVRTACALEVKCRNAFVASRWRADVPDDVLAQVTWQMAVTGYDHVHVAVLIGGNDYRQTVVRRDLAVEQFVTAAVTDFRDRHLIPGVPPPADLTKPAAVLELDALMHPDRVGELSIHEVGEVMEYADLSAAAGAADRALKAARARLGVLAAGRRLVLFDGQPAYEFSPVSRRNCDLEALAERHPAAYADCVAESTHYAIRLDKAYRRKP